MSLLQEMQWDLRGDELNAGESTGMKEMLFTTYDEEMPLINKLFKDNLDQGASRYV